MKVYLLNRADVRVFCDGKLLPIRREAGTEYIQTDKADGETVVLRLVRKHELSRPLWALYALLFWIVGIMGFFTPRYSKFPHSLDCSVSFTPSYELSNLSSGTCLEGIVTRTCTRPLLVLIYPANMIRL